MKIKNVLVFPGGTEIGLEIYKSLRNIKNIKLFSAGSNVSNPAPFYFKNHEVIPSIFEKDWIKSLNNTIEKNKIDYIFPAYDDIIVELAKNKHKINTNIISSPLETCLITRSKLKTYKFLERYIPVPNLFKNPSEIEKFPVFLKLDKGQGSKNTYFVESIEELKILMYKHPNLIILEFLPGKEYTIDCFSDRNKGLLYCQGRERIRIRNGISVNSKIVKNTLFKKYALIIEKHLKFYGAWFFQLKEDINGILKLMEIAPRIAGTMALNRSLGINFPLLSIYEHEGVNISILYNEYDLEIDRALENRYKSSLTFETVYMDFDDTLIIKNRVSNIVLQFLYECIKKNKKIILITKHEGDILETLEKYKIHKGIFNEIYTLKQDELKSSYITDKNSIFLDDSFKERREVAERCKIPTFDVSMIKSLLEDKN